MGGGGDLTSFNSGPLSSATGKMNGRQKNRNVKKKRREKELGKTWNDDNIFTTP